MEAQVEKKRGATMEEEEQMKEKMLNKPLPFHKLLGFADAIDWVLMGLGTLGSIVHGMAQPVGYLLLGKALDAFGKNTHDHNQMVKALLKVYTVYLPLSVFCFPTNIYPLTNIII